MKEEAINSLSKLHLSEQTIPHALCVFDNSWHQGVIGILASRLKDRYHRPVIAFASADEEVVKGSARSIQGFHIRDALDVIATENPGLIEKFGGHAMAAGLSLPAENLQAFIEHFEAYAFRHLNESDLAAEFPSDGNLSEEDFSLQVATLLRNGGPWGQHFPEPQFDGCFQLLRRSVVGEHHLKMVLQYQDETFTKTQAQTEAKDKPIVDAIAFNVDAELQASLEVGDSLHIGYRLDVNHFRGADNLQLVVDFIDKQPSMY